LCVLGIVIFFVVHWIILLCAAQRNPCAVQLPYIVFGPFCPRSPLVFHLKSISCYLVSSTSSLLFLWSHSVTRPFYPSVQKHNPCNIYRGCYRIYGPCYHTVRWRYVQESGKLGLGSRPRLKKMRKWVRRRFCVARKNVVVNSCELQFIARVRVTLDAESCVTRNSCAARL